MKAETRIRMGLVVASVAVLTFAAFSAGPTLAAKGGKTHAPSVPAGLSVSPNPVAAGGATYTISGVGFAPNTLLQLFVYEPDGHASAGQVTTDGTGSFGSVNGVTNPAGSYKVEAWSVGNPQQLLATTTFQAVAP